MVTLHESTKINDSGLPATSEGRHSWPQDGESSEVPV